MSESSLEEGLSVVDSTVLISNHIDTTGPEPSVNICGVVRIDRSGFTYKGEKIEDVGLAYNLLMDLMDTHSRPYLENLVQEYEDLIEKLESHGSEIDQKKTWERLKSLRRREWRN